MSYVPSEVAISSTQPTQPYVELWVDPNGTWASEYATKAYVDGSGWTNVTFENGWVNYGGAYDPARFTKVGNVVYVVGLVKNGTIGTNVCTLPSGYRPSNQLIIAAVTNSNTIGRMDILTSGGVVANAGSNAWFSICTSFVAA